jgi:hypothetical protein
VANGKLSRAQVGLALASALVVLLASGVAISRIAERDGESPVATGPSSTSSSLPGLGQPGPAVGSGPATAAGTGAPAEQAAPASGEAASGVSPVTHGVTRTARNATGNAGPSASASSAASTGSGSPGGSDASAGASPPNGGSPGGGQESPPAPSQQPPEALAAASVSAGEGAQGAVVGAGLNGGPELDLTVGSNPVVGDHPPSEGTGVTFGGRLLHPPPSLPVLPG